MTEIKLPGTYCPVCDTILELQGPCKHQEGESMSNLIKCDCGATYDLTIDKCPKCDPSFSGNPENDHFSRIQREVGDWARENFGNNVSKWTGAELGSIPPLLGIQEEVGELSHTVVYRHQGRGYETDQEYREAVEDALGDIMIFLCDFSCREGIELLQVLQAVWWKVQKRRQKSWQEDKAKEGQGEGMEPKYSPRYAIALFKEIDRYSSIADSDEESEETDAACENLTRIAEAHGIDTDAYETWGELGIELKKVIKGSVRGLDREWEKIREGFDSRIIVTKSYDLLDLIINGATYKDREEARESLRAIAKEYGVVAEKYDTWTQVVDVIRDRLGVGKGDDPNTTPIHPKGFENNVHDIDQSTVSPTTSRVERSLKLCQACLGEKIVRKPHTKNQWMDCPDCKGMGAYTSDDTEERGKGDDPNTTPRFPKGAWRRYLGCRIDLCGNCKEPVILIGQTPLSHIDSLGLPNGRSTCTNSPDPFQDAEQTGQGWAEPPEEPVEDEVPNGFDIARELARTWIEGQDRKKVMEAIDRAEDRYVKYVTDRISGNLRKFSEGVRES